MQQHERHHAVRGVTMQAARHTAEIPLRVRQIFNGSIGAVDTGFEKNVYIDSARGHDPEQVEQQRPKVVKGIDRGPKSGVESLFYVPENAPSAALPGFDREEFQHKRITDKSIG